MAFETRKLSMAWMEHGLSLKRYALSMEDKMVAGAFGCARNYGWWYLEDQYQAFTYKLSV